MVVCTTAGHVGTYTYCPPLLDFQIVSTAWLARQERLERGEDLGWFAGLEELWQTFLR